MDANGHRFWMLADQKAFKLSDGSVEWDGRRRLLRLAGIGVGAIAANADAARDLAARAPLAADRFGAWAYRMPADGPIVARSDIDGQETVIELPADIVVHDIALDQDGVLHLCVANADDVHSLLLVDLRGRWSETVELEVADGRPDRLAILPEGGALLLQRSSGALWQVKGRPLPDVLVPPSPQPVFRPAEENPDPPHLVALDPVDLAAGRTCIAIAAHPTDGAGILVVEETGATDAELVLIADDGSRLRAGLPGVRTPYSLGFITDTQFVVLIPDLSRAIAFGLQRGADAVITVSGSHFPLVGGVSPAIANGPVFPARYAFPDEAGGYLRPRPLQALSQVRLRSRGTAGAADLIDSGRLGARWHRAYVEAVLPPGTGVVLSLSAADDPEAIDAAPAFEHRFGTAWPAEGGDIPHAAWSAERCELPYHPGLLCAPPERDRAGLFSVLIQRHGKKVRNLDGRYLKVVMTLIGSGQASPQIAALRFYESRFSYVDNYLPSHYREALVGAAAEVDGAASQPDFLQRFATLFEGELTGIEDKVAAAHVVTNPMATPPEALDWLSNWIGVSLLPGLPLKRRRRMLAEATALYRRRGTLSGLTAALDAATGDLVSKRQIVLLEDYRLRRTFSTILGADLGRRDDPLLNGFIESGNSFIGDSLFLGDLDTGKLAPDQQAELLSLYRADIGAREGLSETIEDFFERLAHRLTVLVQQDLSEADREIVRQIVALETPAHVKTTVLTASAPLIVGLYALIGVDTYLRRRAAPAAVQLDRSVIGGGDQVRGLPSLDPRLEGGLSQ